MELRISSSLNPKAEPRLGLAFPQMFHNFKLLCKSYLCQQLKGEFAGPGCSSSLKDQFLAEFDHRSLRSSAMAVAGFYKRVLPSPPAIDFTSSNGKQIFREAIQEGTMEGFFNLIAHFQTQAEPAFCGLTSLSVVLNALSVDPGRKWKGPWRWFDESMLDCCEPLERVKDVGITFGKVARLAECAGASVQAFRADKSSLDTFRQHIQQCVSSDISHLVASYSRKTFQQTGIGHFSPIGGYHSGRDMALILDVARFKYPPHWVPVSLLWEAINTVDSSTGQLRGYMLISKREQSPSILFTLSCRSAEWKAMSRYLLQQAPQLMQNEEIKVVEDVFSIFTHSFPGDVSSLVNWIAEVKRSSKNLEQDEALRLDCKVKILQELRATKLHMLVTDWMKSKGCTCSATLSENVVRACCDGAALLSGCCNVSNLKCKYTMKTNMDRLGSTVAVNEPSNASDVGVDILVPTAPSGLTKCGGLCHLHPASADLLSVILLALPTHTWEGIKSSDVKAILYNLVSCAGLPSELQEEIQHVKRQLQVVGSCDIEA